MFDKTAQLYDLIYSFKDYEKESLEIRDYIRKLNPLALSILDVACGTGKHAQYLSGFFKVDGIDLNEEFVEIAAERNPMGIFLCRDMTKFQLNKQYDIVMCLFSSIAYVKTYDLLVESLKQCKSHLNKNGIMIIEPWFSPEDWETGRVDMFTIENEKGDKVCRMSHAERQDTISVLQFHYLIGRNSGLEHHTERHELGLFTVDEMLAAFKSAGLMCEYSPVGISGRGIYIAQLSATGHPNP